MELKNIVIVLLACFIITGAFGLVVADEDSATDSEDNAETDVVIAPAPTDSAEDGSSGIGQTTFLQCVSDAAKVKSTCYESASTTTEDCQKTAFEENLKNGDAVKIARKECKTVLKESKKQCKTEFKATKAECKKIKHSFLDSIRAMFM